MPSQNLPKPNLPGQAQSAPSISNPASSIASPASIPNTTQVAPKTEAQTVFEQRPGQIRQTQVIPGGLSRENPGGTPPNMRVAAPNSSVPDSNLNTKPAEETKQPEIKPQQDILSRPMSPLGQISLKPNAQPVSPVNNSLPKTDIQADSEKNPVQSDNSIKAPSFLNNTAKTEPAIASAPPAPTNPAAATATPAVATTKSTESVSSEPAKPAAKFSNPLEKIKGKIPKPLMIGGIVVVVLLLALLLFSLFKPKSSSTKTTTKSGSTTNTGSSTNSASSTNNTNNGQVTTLTYWGLWEDSQILKEVIADFESKNPSIKIDYRKQSHRDYRERLQQAIDSGNGPDIFRYHVDWVPMLSANLAAMPSTVMSTADYKQIFYPTAYNNLQVGGQIVGIPLMYDGLALFYNKEMLKTANISVPTTWAELRTAANKLTVPANVAERQGGNITRAGLAIGNAGNVDHFSDILALLVIQNGGNPADAKSQYVKDAITFYTNFIKQDKVWSDRLANSTTAFARGDVAMIFAPSWRAHDIKNLNPNLDFAIARTPQLDSANPVAWATFWAEGVNGKSKNKDAAWTFLKYLSTPEVLRKFYNDASQYRAFGEIYPRTDMKAELQSSELVGAFVEDASIAKSWYMASFTHDNGLNDQIIKYYEDAINGVLSGTNTEKTLETAATGVTSVLSKYSSSK